MNTFSLVHLPNEEPYPIFWLRLCIIKTLIMDGKGVVLSNATPNERDAYISEEGYSEFITKGTVLSDRLDYASGESTGLRESSEHNLFFDVSLQDIRSCLFRLSGKSERPSEDETSEFEIVVPKQTVKTSFFFSHSDSAGDIVSILLSDYNALSHEDVKSILLPRESLQMSMGDGRIFYKFSDK
jgi:hypothetical protein